MLYNARHNGYNLDDYLIDQIIDEIDIFKTSSGLHEQTYER